MRTVYLICPDPLRAISGGHVYNRSLLQAAHKAAYPMQWCPYEAGLSQSSGVGDAIWLWDSLYLPRLAAAGFRPRAGQHLALLHGLLGLDLSAPEMRALLESFQCVVVPGANVCARLSGLIPAGRVVVIEPGVSEAFRRREPRRPDGLMRLVTVANLLEAKRPLELLEVLASLGGGWSWDWLGADSSRRGLALDFMDLSQARGLQGRVRLCPAMSQPQLARWLPGYDLMIFASREETYGMAIAEALAVGLPVLTTRVGEASRLVQHGRTGWVVDNEVDALSPVLQALLEDPACLARVRPWVGWRQQRSWQRVYQDFAELFAWL